MDWTRYIDGYCERTDPSYWAEPLNAVTNAAFLLVAWFMLRRVAHRDMPLAVVLTVMMVAIGVGSYLFHTYATAWASAADVIPIVLFILVYVFAATRDMLDLGPWAALGVTVLFIPYAGSLGIFFEISPFFEISSFYWPVPVLIFVYAALLSTRAPKTALGLALGASLLCVSLIFRSLDQMVCDVVPMGTHFVWHLLNAVMLGWMIEVYRRHLLAARGAGR